MKVQGLLSALLAGAIALAPAASFALPQSAGALAARKVGAPTYDLNFMSNGLPVGMTFTRASTATDLTYLSNTATYNSFSNNAIRQTPGLGVLSEGARTNYLLISGAPATQTTGSLPVSTDGAYTLWVIGSGSATVSAGTAVGNNFGTASQGSPLVFNITAAGTVTVTVSGTLLAFQLEQGPGPSSFIPTTTATAARAQQVFYIRGNTISPYGGSFAAQFLPHSGGVARVDNHVACTTSGPTPFALFNSNNLNPGAVITDAGTSITHPQLMSFGAFHRGASSWGSRGLSITFDGNPVAFSNLYTASGAYTWGLLCSVFAQNSQSQLDSGYMQRERFWNYQLSPEMILQLSNGR